MEEIKVITIDDNEEYLRSVSAPIIENDPDLERDIDVLARFCQANEVMAMAAIQLGIPKRLLYLKNTDIETIKRIQNNKQTAEDIAHNEAKVLINPTFISREGLTEYWESCASCQLYCGRVQRPYRITLEYYDTDFQKHIESFEGFPATVISHEMDHLDGILHMDVALEVLQMPQEERKVFRRTHGYTILKKDGDYESLREPSKKAPSKSRKIKK